MAVTGYHHICVHAKNMDESIAFYTDIIGFKLIGRETCAFGGYAMLRLNDARLELICPNDQDEDTFGDKGALAHIGFDVEDIDGTVAAMREKGIQFKTDYIQDEDEPMGGLRAIQLLGPAGEHINLYAFKNQF